MISHKLLILKLDSNYHFTSRTWFRLRHEALRIKKLAVVDDDHQSNAYVFTSHGSSAHLSEPFAQTHSVMKIQEAL